MPELLGLLFLSLLANLASVYIWFQQVHLLRNDEKMIQYLKTQVAQRNGLIARLVHEADKDYCEDRLLIQEAEAALGNTEDG
jgi:hypothetical protein